MRYRERDETRQLDERIASEASFHDAKYSGEDVFPRHYSVAPTTYVYDRLYGLLGDISGKDVLEYGCGDGWITLDLARQGANISAFDISPQAVFKTKELLQSHGLEQRCEIDVMPAERLRFPAESFDIAVGFAIIHHLDLNASVAELHRVLRPGGIALFAEPLATNPAISLYRRLTPQFRTVDERPLVLQELPALFANFSAVEHQEYFLTALAGLSLAYLPFGANAYPAISRALHRFDSMLLRHIPALGSLAWYTIIKITK